MKSNKGFSLVELIVVIALMAIIAGVAIPVYTNYIDKANKAVDENLINEAVYAAKLANIDPAFDGATVTVTAGSKLLTITSANDAAAEQVAKVVGAEKVENGKYTIALETDIVYPAPATPAPATPDVQG